MASLARILAFALFFVVRFAAAAASEPKDSYPEASVKAVYLYRFPGYIEWPEEVRLRPRFIIAVLSDDGVADALARVLPDHPIGNKPAELRIAHNTDELSDAQVA